MKSAQKPALTPKNPPKALAERRLWKLMEGLEPQEYKRFRQWIALKDQNSHHQLLTLFDQLGAHAAKETQWQALYPDKRFNDNAYRKLIRILTQELEVFIIMEDIRADPRKREWLLTQSLNRRGLIPLFRQSLKKFKARLRKKELLDLTHFDAQLDVLRQEQIALLKDPEKDRHCWREIVRAMEEKVAVHFLSVAVDLQNCAHKLGEDIPMPLLAPLLEGLAQHPTLRDKPLLQLYQHIHALNEGRDESLEPALALWQSLAKKLAPDTRRNLATLLINYCNRQLNTQADRRFVEIQLPLFQMGMESFFRIDGEIPVGYYKVYVLLLLYSGQYSEARKQVQLLKKYLPPNLQEAVSTLMEAKVQYACTGSISSHQYRYLNQAAFPTMHDKIQVRIFLLQIRFGMGELVDLERSINTLYEFVRKQSKLSEAHQQPYKNFLTLFTRLVKTAQDPDADWEDLRLKIHETKPKSLLWFWLLEQIDQAIGQAHQKTVGSRRSDGAP